jgi:hypothetical protein
MNTLHPVAPFLAAAITCPLCGSHLRHIVAGVLGPCRVCDLGPRPQEGECSDGEADLSIGSSVLAPLSIYQPEAGEASDWPLRLLERNQRILKRIRQLEEASSLDLPMARPDRERRILKLLSLLQVAG